MSGNRRTVAQALAAAAMMGAACGPGSGPEPSPRPDRNTPHQLSSPLPAASPAPTEEGRNAAVLRDLEDADKRARAEAMATYSDGSGAAPTGVGDPERDARTVSKRLAMQRVLQEKYRAQVALRHGMTVEQLAALKAPASAAPQATAPR
jgi:hypothetical protein